MRTPPDEAGRAVELTLIEVDGWLLWSIGMVNGAETVCSRRYSVATLSRVSASAKGAFTGVAPDILIVPDGAWQVRVVVTTDAGSASVMVSPDDLVAAVASLAARVKFEREPPGP